MTTKDAYWFTHDSNAKDDPKCMLLIDQLGMEGYGIYWVLVETLREQPGYRYPLRMLPILAKRYMTSGEKMKAVVMNYDLFDVADDEFFFSHSLNTRMEKLDYKREQARQAGIESGKKRRLLAQANDRSTDAEHASNGSRTNTVQYSTVDNSINTSIESARNFYKAELDSNKGKDLVEQYSMTADYILKQDALPKMDKQLSYRSFVTCYGKAREYGYKLSDYLKKMENWKDGNKKDVTKKNKCISQTLQNWMQRDAERSGKIYQ